MEQLHQNKLAVLAEDTPTLEALKLIMIEKIESAKPIIEIGDTDVMLGQKYRAYKTAKKIANDMFTSIKNYKKTNKSDQGFDKSK